MYADGALTTNKLIDRYQLAKLHTFEAVARHSSFALAADELCISPSAVSHQINKLEQELSIKLFNRFHRRIELTQEGANLFNVINQSLCILNQEIIGIKNQELSGKLTVYCRPSIAAGWLVPRLQEFTRQHPAITLSLITGNEVINFNKHRIDLAIYYDDLRDNTLITTHLMNEIIVPVCSPEYAESRKLTGHPQNLNICMLLHDTQAWKYDSNYDEWSTWASHFDLKYDFNTIPGMLFDRSDLAIQAAVNHAGIAMGRMQIITKYIESGQLIMPFSQSEVSSGQRYYTVCPEGQYNLKVRAFIRWLKESVNCPPED